MLRIHLMQNWWSLTDDAMEDALIDSNAIRGFAGIDLAEDNIPDATTILAFRHFVKQHHLAEEIFKAVEQYWEEKDLLLRRGRWWSHHHPCPHLHKEREEGGSTLPTPTPLLHCPAETGGFRLA